MTIPATNREVGSKPSPVRWVASALLILYGFAKLNGSQFTILDSELSKPMGEVSGFWLTWYYFGYSKFYGSLIALLQIGGAVLLVWPRTALAAALLLVPVVGNIVLIDIFYGVSGGAMMVALVILACLLAVIVPHARRLLSAVTLDPGSRMGTPVRMAILVVLLAGGWTFTWYVAHYNNRAPTRIDGVWSVTAPVESDLRRVFFEYNRAHLAVFRTADGRDRTHHFEVDDAGVVRVWERWLSKGDLIMEGRIASATEIELTSPGDGATGLKLQLVRRSGP